MCGLSSCMSAGSHSSVGTNREHCCLCTSVQQQHVPRHASMRWISHVASNLRHIKPRKSHLVIPRQWFVIFSNGVKFRDRPTGPGEGSGWSSSVRNEGRKNCPKKQHVRSANHGFHTITAKCMRPCESSARMSAKFLAMLPQTRLPPRGRERGRENIGALGSPAAGCRAHAMG